jgi:hypothetical protein
MSAGDVPKTAWINPSGGHLGRQTKVWPDPIIFKRILLPWIANQLDVSPLPPTEKKNQETKSLLATGLMVAGP